MQVNEDPCGQQQQDCSLSLDFSSIQIVHKFAGGVTNT